MVDLQWLQQSAPPASPQLARVPVLFPAFKDCPIQRRVEVGGHIGREPILAGLQDMIEFQINFCIVSL